MKHPSLFRWLQRWAIGSIVCLLLFALGLAIANLVDYAPYGIALWRATHLKPGDLAALGEACSRHEENGHQRASADAIPREFRKLKPVRVDVNPGCSDFTLLEQGDDRYVFLRISTSPENEVITLVSYDGIRQRSRRLWAKSSELEERLNPVGRILTVSQLEMASGRDWIVLPDRLLVIDRYYTVGSSDQIVASVSINAEQREAVRSCIEKTETDAGGRAFYAHVTDGVELHILLSPDGSSNSKTDIVLANAWRTEVDPLVRMVSQIVGKEYAVTASDIIQRMEGLRRRDTFTMPLSDYERRYQAPRPWWCWWPRFGFLPH